MVRMHESKLKSLEFKNKKRNIAKQTRTLEDLILVARESDDNQSSQ